MDGWMTEGWEGEEGRSFVLGPLGGYLFLFSFFSFSLSTVRAPVVSRLLGLPPPLFIELLVVCLMIVESVRGGGLDHGSDCSVVGPWDVCIHQQECPGGCLWLGVGGCCVVGGWVLLADNLQGLSRLGRPPCGCLGGRLASTAGGPA